MQGWENLGGVPKRLTWPASSLAFIFDTTGLGSIPLSNSSILPYSILCFAQPDFDNGGLGSMHTGPPRLKWLDSFVGWTATSLSSVLFSFTHPDVTDNNGWKICTNPNLGKNRLVMHTRSSKLIIFCGSCKGNEHFDASYLAEGLSLQAHKDKVAEVGAGSMDLRKPRICCCPWARWLWNLKTAAEEPQIHLTFSHVSPQVQLTLLHLHTTLIHLY